MHSSDPSSSSSSAAPPPSARGESKKSRHAKSRSISIASRFFGHAEAPASPQSLQEEKNARSRYVLRRQPRRPPPSFSGPLCRVGYDESARRPVFILAFNSLQHRLQSSDLLKLQLQLLLRQRCISPPSRIASTTQLEGREIHQHLLQWFEIIQGEDKHQLYIIAEYVETLLPMEAFLHRCQAQPHSPAPPFSALSATLPKRSLTPTAVAAPLAVPEGVSSRFAVQLFSLLLHLHRLVQLIPQLHSQWTLFFRPDSMYVHLVDGEDGAGPEYRIKLGVIGLSPLSFSLKHDSRTLVEQRSLISSWFHSWCAAGDPAGGRAAQLLLLPPEQIDRSSASFIFGESISVWFLGVFLFQLLSGGRLPFCPPSGEDPPLEVLFQRIATYSSSDFTLANIPEKFHHDLLAMLQSNPFERICLEDLCRSPVWSLPASPHPAPSQQSDPSKSDPSKSDLEALSRPVRRGSYKKDKNAKVQKSYPAKATKKNSFQKQII